MHKVSPQKVTETLGRHMLVDALPIVADLERSFGNRLIDAVDGRSYLDCFSYIASNPIGHNHPKLRTPELEERLLRAALVKPSNPDFSTVELASFVEVFARAAKPDQFKYLFFVEGGSAAVENGLKTAFDWKVRKNFARGSTAELGTKVIHFQQSFHGRGGYTLSLTNTADPRKTKYFPKFDWPRISNPKLTFPLSPEREREAARSEAEAEAQIRAAFAQHGPDIAAIIIEPIQGEGGDNHFRPEFHQLLRRIADEQEALLIYDEVQSGMGLTGRMWAYQHYGMTPDIVCFGKKAQVCGIMVSRRIDDVADHVFKEASRINSTWGGNLVDMVRCQRYLEIIEEDRLVENAARVGDYLLRGLEKLCAEHPHLFSNARGKGLMCALDAATPELRESTLTACLARGVLLLKCGTKSIRLRPSLTFTTEEADEALAGLQAAALHL